MNREYAIGLLCIVAVLIALCGCTAPSPAPDTSVPVVTTATATPGPQPAAYPGALDLGRESLFGIAGQNGTATVYRAETRSEYQWSSPSFNSPHEQQEAGDSIYTTQHGYNTETATEGSTFLFVSVRLTDTGTDRMTAPSPGQFIVDYDGKQYAYSSVRGSDVIVNSARVSQYDYQIGTGGTAGTIAPGAGNAADGFLIYEVPAAIDLSKAVMVITLDPQHTTAWKLG